MGDMVTISMPVGPGLPTETLRRAIQAVLDQDHQDWHLIVTSDGQGDTPWQALDQITDPRITCWETPARRGRYWIDAVTLASTDADTSPWWTVHDADDAAAPTWLSRMLEAVAATRRPVVLTSQIVHAINGTSSICPVRPITEAGTGRVTHYAHMAGLWNTRWVRGIVGPHPGYQVGWDTVMTAIPLLLEQAAVIDEPLYHRWRRAGSLTMDRATGHRSLARREAAARIAATWPRIVDAAHAGGTDAVGRVIVEDVPAEVWAEVKTDTDLLAAVTAGVVAAQETGGGGPRCRHATDLVTTEALWTGWALDRGTAAELDAYLATARPGVIVETGSGASTLVLARYAAATGATVVSLEHDDRWRHRTLEALDRHNLAGAVDVRLAPLTQTPSGPWYQCQLPDGIDFVLLDGPPEGTGGRAACLGQFMPRLALGWEVWLDDGARPGEIDAVMAWEAEWPLDVTAMPGPKRPLRITARQSSDRGALVDGSRVTVTVLTGGRPHLLARTVTALRVRAPGLLETAHLVVVCNGQDQGTMDILDGFRDDIDQVIPVGGARSLAGVGEATSRCAAAAASSARDQWLHVEDDWILRSRHTGWLQDAQNVLDGDPRIAQVRLRHFGERTLARHMVTGAGLDWLARDTHLVAVAAHWTFNPCLMRVAQALRVFPAGSEAEAQRAATAAGLHRVAQLLPGGFNHIGGQSGGGDESLRARTGSV